MKNVNLTRAWKDPFYRSTLEKKELFALPGNPAGLMEVTDEELRAVNGGTTITCGISIGITITVGSIIAVTYVRNCYSK